VLFQQHHRPHLDDIAHIESGAENAAREPGRVPPHFIASRSPCIINQNRRRPPKHVRHRELHTFGHQDARREAYHRARIQWIG